MNTRDTDCAGTVCNPELIVFPAVKKRQVTASFSGGEVSSDGGLVLLRQADPLPLVTRHFRKNWQMHYSMYRIRLDLELGRQKKVRLLCKKQLNNI